MLQLKVFDTTDFTSQSGEVRYLKDARQQLATLQVKVRPVELALGKVMVAVYSSREDFPDSFHSGSARKAVVGEMQFEIPGLPAGEYAVLAFHDVNNNGVLDMNRQGIPLEPWGGSINGENKAVLPSWANTCFDLPVGGRCVDVMLHDAQACYVRGSMV